MVTMPNPEADHYRDRVGALLAGADPDTRKAAAATLERFLGAVNPTTGRPVFDLSDEVRAAMLESVEKAKA